MFMWSAIVWPVAVTCLWLTVFGIAVFFSRMGLKERDAETQKEIEEEAKAESGSGWTPLLS